MLARKCESALRVLRRWLTIRHMRTPVQFAISAALPLACCAIAAAAVPETQPRVITVDCPANDQTGSARLQAGETMSAPVAPALAGQIAYYRAEHSPGVYAPRGWSCRAWDGSNGSTLVVTPKRMEPPYFPLPMITGPAVMIETSDAASSGRFHVAIVAAQLFPLVGSAFVTRVRQEHLISDSSFDVESYPDDRLIYLSDRLVQFTTPPNRAGLGTAGMFEVSDLPVRGLSIFNLESEANALIEVRVRLPAGLNAVAEAVVQLETTCVQLPRGCRGIP
jgi:hypothetical protein